MRLVESLLLVSVTAGSALPLAATADDGSVCSIQQVPARLVDDATLCAFESDFSTQYAAGGFAEAADIAKRYLTDATLDLDQRAYVVHRLAAAQRRQGELEAAIENYDLAIELVEEASDRLDGRLVDPLEGLGLSLMEVRDYMPAIAALERAAHITRVSMGPFNTRQGSIADALVEVYAMAGRPDLALDAQSMQIEAYARAYGVNDPRVIESWQTRGELLSQAGLHEEAIRAFEEAIKLVRQREGYYDEALLPLLDSIAASFINYGSQERMTRIGLSKRFLERKVIIVKKNEDIDPETRARVFVQMGDFLLKYSGWEFAMPNYRDAWDELGRTENAGELRQQLFDEPKLLIGEELTLEHGTQFEARETLADQGYQAVPVVVAVSEFGGPDDVSVPDEELLPDAAVKRSLSLARKFKFRPRLTADGATPSSARYTLAIEAEPPGFTSTTD